jgi:tRNA-Thr(GGU) m(6)t(6)A37 methyltransferase TsaA
MTIVYQPIGVIHSPFDTPENMPIQPASAASRPGWVEVFPAFERGLADLEGFSHLILIYHFHQVGGMRLTVTPFMDHQPRGVFATRAPLRPNPIGLSVVQLLSRVGCRLEIANLDVLDGTPLLDIKPYIPDFDQVLTARIGWLETARQQIPQRRSDGRFSDQDQERKD